MLLIAISHGGEGEGNHKEGEDDVRRRICPNRPKRRQEQEYEGGDEAVNRAGDGRERTQSVNTALRVAAPSVCEVFCLRWGGHLSPSLSALSDNLIVYYQ